MRAGYPSSNGGSAGGPSRGFSRLLVLAYILAFSLPPLGLVLGVTVALRLGKPRHAIWIVVISLVATAVWVLLLTSGSFNNAGTDY